MAKQTERKYNKHRFIYLIYTSYYNELTGKTTEPSLWVKCNSLKEVGRFLEMTANQIAYLFNGKDNTGWIKKDGLYMVKRLEKPLTVKQKKRTKNILEQVEEWFEILEPLNSKPKLSEKLHAHIELKTFVKQFILDEK